MVCKFMKKTVVGAGLGALALGLLFGTSAPSYVRTAFHKVRHEAKDAVPIQFEIDRAKQEIAALEPAIHDHIEALARAQVDVEMLDQEIAVTKANLDREAQQMVALNDSLKSGRFQLTSGGSTYTADDLKADLAHRLDQYRNGKAVLLAKEETLKVRRENVAAAEKGLEEMRDQRRTLMTEVEGIEAKLKQVEATQNQNEFTYDATPLARVKQTVAELKRRVEVKARVVEQEGRFTNRLLPTAAIEPSRDICTEIDAELGHCEAAEGKSL